MFMTSYGPRSSNAERAPLLMTMPLPLVALVKAKALVKTFLLAVSSRSAGAYRIYIAASPSEPCTVTSSCKDTRYEDILFVWTTKLGLSHCIRTAMVMVLLSKDDLV